MVRSHIATVLGQATSFLSRLSGRGTGITWAGEVALRADPNFIQQYVAEISERIIVAGTNGKTTTSALTCHILKNEEYTVVHNATGANLLNGIAGTLIANSNEISPKTVAVFESDEAALASIAAAVQPTILVLLNLFRDQLDRYGEVDVIAEKWKEVVKSLPKDTVIIANADDPLIVHIAQTFKGKVEYFGITDKKLGREKIQHATDSTYCLECGHKLSYHTIYFSHIGDWYCMKCNAKRPEVATLSIHQPLVGTYNIYNVLAAFYIAKRFKLSTQSISKALTSFKPAFGRQEEFEKGGKKIQVFLSKNPTGFNENLKTILNEKKAGTMVLILNDRIPDGTDVSWIWDVDFELLEKAGIPIIATGDRAYDMGLRIKYSREKLTERTKEPKEKDGVRVEENFKDAIDYALSKTTSEKVCYILPTYSAMLEVRKYLSGRKIL